MTITADTRLTAAVLQALGFVRQPAEAGEPATFALVRYGQRVAVTANPAAWGAGWDLAGMKPADVGDLFVMLFLAGDKEGRLASLHATLENAPIGDVARWLSAVRNLKLVDADPPEPAKKPAAKKPAAKKPAAKKSRVRLTLAKAKPPVRRAKSNSDRALEMKIRG